MLAKLFVSAALLALLPAPASAAWAPRYRATADAVDDNADADAGCDDGDGGGCEPARRGRRRGADFAPSSVALYAKVRGDDGSGVPAAPPAEQRGLVASVAIALARFAATLAFELLFDPGAFFRRLSALFRNALSLAVFGAFVSGALGIHAAVLARLAPAAAPLLFGAGDIFAAAAADAAAGAAAAADAAVGADADPLAALMHLAPAEAPPVLPAAPPFLQMPLLAQKDVDTVALVCAISTLGVGSSVAATVADCCVM